MDVIDEPMPIQGYAALLAIPSVLWGELCATKYSFRATQYLSHAEVPQLNLSGSGDL